MTYGRTKTPQALLMTTSFLEMSLGVICSCMPSLSQILHYHSASITTAKASIQSSLLRLRSKTTLHDDMEKRLRSSSDKHRILHRYLASVDVEKQDDKLVSPHAIYLRHDISQHTEPSCTLDGPSYHPATSEDVANKAWIPVRTFSYRPLD